MSRRFIYFTRAGKPSRPVSLGGLMAVARRRVVLGRGPFAFSVNDKNRSNFRTRGDLLARFEQVVKGTSDVGDVWRIETRSGKVVLRAREIKQAVDVINTNGNRKADLLWSAVVAEFGGLHFLGAYVCKSVSGSGGVPSQHSYGNAVDIGAATMPNLLKIAAWCVAHADEYDLEHVIVDQKIWTRGQGWHYYSGDRHYHVHDDFSRNCTGPCGVKSCD